MHLTNEGIRFDHHTVFHNRTVVMAIIIGVKERKERMYVESIKKIYGEIDLAPN